MKSTTETDRRLLVRYEGEERGFDCLISGEGEFVEIASEHMEGYRRQIVKLDKKGAGELVRFLADQLGIQVP